MSTFLLNKDASFLFEEVGLVGPFLTTQPPTSGRRPEQVHHTLEETQGHRGRDFTRPNGTSIGSGEGRN